MTARADLTIRRGATRPDTVWRMKSGGQPFDGAGSTWILTIVSADNTIRKSTASSDGLSYDNVTGALRWHRTLAESRLIGLGRVGEYEVERRIGADQELVVSGDVIGVGGLGDD